MSKSDLDNRSNQLNPNNDSYYQSRGYDDRDDYYGEDDGGSGPGVIWSRSGHNIPTPEQERQSFLYKKRKDVANAMTTWRAAETLSAMLSHNFPDLAFSSDYEGKSVRITANGCLPRSETAQLVQETASVWLEDREWLVGKCVEDVQFVFRR